MTLNKEVNILLVEDTESDVRLVEEVFKEFKVPYLLWVVRDGEEAVEFLFRRGRHGAATRPDLILLDLNLPKIKGTEVLYQIKNDTDLKSIPTIILTSSRAEEDIAKAYAGHANSYISKPLDLDAFMQVVNNIEKYWLTTVELPKQ